MSPDIALWCGSAAVFGASVMAMALNWGARPRVESPTSEYDVLAEDPLVTHFNEAMDGLLPLFIADAPGLPLDTAEQRAIRDIEHGIGDPDFKALFEGPKS